MTLRNGYRVCADDSDKYEHVAIAERALGRPLPPKAIVHHVNEDKLDNTPSNLVICPDQAYHLLLHARARVVDAGGNPNTQKICGTCRELKTKDEFCQHKRMWDGRSDDCRQCTSKRKKAAQYKRKPEHVAQSNRRRREDPVRWARHLEWSRERRRQKRGVACA